MAVPMQDTYERVFAALAHPARRHILITLNLSGGVLTAGEIAGLFDHAWPTTTRHLQALADAGLVEQQRQGRRQLYRINYEPLDLARQWLASFRPPHGQHSQPRRETWRVKRKR
jgi:DNA-binding transcriptional ArsR family regulator